MNYIVYNNLEDILKNAENAPEKWNCQVYGFHWSSITNPKYPDKRRFYGASTKDVICEIRKTHPKDAKITSNAMLNISSDVFMKKRFSFVNKQLNGCRVDIPRYLSGDPRCFFNVRKVRRENRAVRVYASIGGNCGRSSHELAVCGSLACAVTEYLESNGVNVELWAVTAINDMFSVGGNSKDATDCDAVHLVKLKDSTSYIDLGLVSFICGYDKFFRNIVFKSYYKYGDSVFNMGYRLDGRLGRVVQFNKGMLPPGSDDKENSIIIPQFYSIDGAKRWFNEFVENN